MFKSLFGKKNKNSPEEPGPSDENISDDGFAERSSAQGYAQQPLDQFLEPFFTGLNPGDPNDYIFPLAEVEYLWARFQQLGPDGSLTVSDEVFQEQPLLQEPAFVDQVWKTIPRDENGQVTFQAFVGIIKWWHTAPLEIKIRSTFKLINKSKPLDLVALQQVLMKLETTPDEDTVRQKAELLIAHLDDKNQGFIDEDQWTTFVMQLPDEEINSLTTFNILPPQILPKSPKRGSSDQHSSIPNNILIDVVGRIGEKEWVPLAYQLGFTANDVTNLHLQYPGRSREQAYQMLLKWTQKRQHAATISVLKSALVNCGMDKVAAILEV